MVRVTIPATTANLGSGFDSLGIALNMYNIIEMDEADGCFIDSGDPSIPSDETNLIYVSAMALYRACGRRTEGFRIKEISNIPLARGLGSSSACIVGGIVGANALLGNPLTKEEMLDLALRIEGHPDNIAPAFMGGLVTSAVDEKHVCFVKSELRDDLTYCAFIPPFELRTEDARKALPDGYSKADTVFNLSRAALMSASMASGKYENLVCASKDAVHQPYRMKLIPGAEKLMTRVLGYGAVMSYISGAGSTIMGVFRRDPEKVLMESEFYLADPEYEGWKAVALRVDNEGAKSEVIKEQ